MDLMQGGNVYHAREHTDAAEKSSTVAAHVKRPSRTPGLEALEEHASQFQVEQFCKALSRRGALLHRSNSTKGPADQGAPDNSQFSLDAMLTYTPECIPTSLLRLSSESTGKAVKMFQHINKYMAELSGAQGDRQVKLQIAQKFLHHGLKRPELRNELYMQLLKQTRVNPNLAAKCAAWELFGLVASSMPPSKDFIGLISEYIHSVSHDDRETPEVKLAAQDTLNSLRRTARAGARRTLPSMEEIDAQLSQRPLTTIVYFLDGTFEELTYDLATTVLEAVEQLASIIKLASFLTFMLFECRRPMASKEGGGGCGAAADEHVLLDDNAYIADVLTEWRNLDAQVNRGAFISRFLFKKRMFRDSDEGVTEPQFIRLSYIQAQHDYLQGSYPVDAKEAAQMCALQMQAHHGPALLRGTDSALVQCIDKYVLRSVLSKRSPEEWRKDVVVRYKSLQQLSKEDAKLQFLRAVRALPYGHAAFFTLEKLDDPSGALPNQVVLGINKRGLHFFRPAPREYMHSAMLRDVMQFGASSHSVFFKIRTQGALHIFQFGTVQGEDICMVLQTHVNDIMMKRYTKNPDGESQQAMVALSSELHIRTMQRMLDEANKKFQDMNIEMDQLRSSNDQLTTKLRAAGACLRELEIQKGGLQEQIFSLQRELALQQAQLQLRRTDTITSLPDNGFSLPTSKSISRGSGADETAQLRLANEQLMTKLRAAGDVLRAVEVQKSEMQEQISSLQLEMERKREPPSPGKGGPPVALGQDPTFGMPGMAALNPTHAQVVASFAKWLASIGP